MSYPPSNRVPGLVYRPKDHALDKDLSKMSMRELLDLKSRQLKLLENKFVQFDNFQSFSNNFHSF